MSDLILLEREIIQDLLRDKVFIDFDSTAIFEYKADNSAGFLTDIVDFIEKVE